MATNEAVACCAALQALIDDATVDEDALNPAQWQAAERLHAATQQTWWNSEEDRVLLLALGHLLGDTGLTPRRSEHELAERMLATYRKSMEA